jgi:transposase
VLLDTLSVHHASCIELAVKAVGGHVSFLPPYSPDFSPLDPCWSKLKTYLRSYGARTRQRLDTAVTHALQLIQPQDILGWFRHCGYLGSSE